MRPLVLSWIVSSPLSTSAGAGRCGNWPSCAVPSQGMTVPGGRGGGQEGAWRGRRRREDPRRGRSEQSARRADVGAVVVGPEARQEKGEPIACALSAD